MQLHNYVCVQQNDGLLNYKGEAATLLFSHDARVCDCWEKTAVSSVSYIRVQQILCERTVLSMMVLMEEAMIITQLIKLQ